MKIKPYSNEQLYTILIKLYCTCSLKSIFFYVTIFDVFSASLFIFQKSNSCLIVEIKLVIEEGSSISHSFVHPDTCVHIIKIHIHPGRSIFGRKFSLLPVLLLYNWCIISSTDLLLPSTMFFSWCKYSFYIWKFCVLYNLNTLITVFYFKVIDSLLASAQAFRLPPLNPWRRKKNPNYRLNFSK